MISFNGIYISKPLFERLDQTWFRIYFRFYADGTVKKGCCGDKYDVQALKEMEPNSGSGKITLDANNVLFAIQTDDSDFKSTWIGVINQNTINFRIEDPDFEDIEGTYTFFGF